MLYYFDETADQGYVDKTSSLDQYGLIAGWAFPNYNKDVFEAEIATVLSSFPSCHYKKLHCTELFKNGANSALRDHIFQLLQNLQEYVIIHEGAYPLGVKQHEQVLSEIIKKHLPKVPARKPNKSRSRTRLYSRLLTGVIIKIEEVAEAEGELEAYLISDRVDNSIRKESEQLLKRLRSGRGEIVKKTYDPDAKLSIKRTFEIQTASPGFCCRIERVKRIAYLEEVTPISFIADFICFEMLRHFRRRMKLEKPISFQSPEVLDGFPLKHKIAFLDNNHFTGRVFKPTTDP